MEALAQYYQDCLPAPQELAFNESNDNLSVIELFYSKADNKVQWRTLRVHGIEKDAWLSTSVDSKHPDQSILVQILQIHSSPETILGSNQLDIRKSNFKAVINKFGIHDTVTFGQSSVQSFAQVSEKDGKSNSIHTMVHITDYFAIFYRFHKENGVTQGVCWAGEKVLPFLYTAIIRNCTLAGHPFYLNLCTTMAFEAAITRRLTSTSEIIAGVERRTGFKVWDLHRFKPLQGSYSALSATTSGYATSLAANRRLNRLSRCMLMSFEGSAGALASTTKHPGQCSNDLMASRVNTLLQQIEVQLILIDFLTTRVQNQLTALFNLVAKKDMDATISLAEDSRTVATASKRDSTSMKTLAAMTVIFLPGTFIASLFSTSLFDWQADSNTSVLSNRFWVYWAITIPLTVITIAVWLLWTWREELLHRDRELRAQEERRKRMEMDT